AVTEQPVPLERTWAGAAVAFDGAGQPFMVRVTTAGLLVAKGIGQLLDVLDDPLPPSIVRWAPAIAVSAHRICVAWSSEGWQPSVFVRCHRR
ncbi:MAG TPA: hypothetical protein PLF40_31240, partial [Kofleriaceae bacterium]|nr:hypothetical protein [Kofleriaceae bacterium]